MTYNTVTDINPTPSVDTASLYWTQHPALFRNRDSENRQSPLTFQFHVVYEGKNDVKHYSISLSLLRSVGPTTNLETEVFQTGRPSSISSTTDLVPRLLDEDYKQKDHVTGKQSCFSLPREMTEREDSRRPTIPTGGRSYVTRPITPTSRTMTRRGRTTQSEPPISLTEW